MTTVLPPNDERKTLRLTYVGFDGVEFDLYEGDDFHPARHVRVNVGSGTSVRQAIRFPDMRSEASASTGDEDLDREIRDRAAEELARLEGASAALRAAA